jgi:LPS-assembly lipoprotein
MSCFRALLPLLLVCGTVACGFQPLYGPPPETADAAAAPGTAPPSNVAALATISVDRIPNREGQQLRTRLTQLLGNDGASQRYRLDVNIKTESESLALRRTGLATRASLRMSAQYRLVDVNTDQVVLKSAARGISSYNLLDEDFSTLASLQDAQNRLIDQMAIDIRNRLAVFFLAGPPPSEPAAPADPVTPAEPSAHADPAAPT